jgi:hypothetical protein
MSLTAKLHDLAQLFQYLFVDGISLVCANRLQSPCFVDMRPTLKAGGIRGSLKHSCFRFSKTYSGYLRSSFS